MRAGQNGLTPFHNSVSDSMLLEKRKDLLGDLVGGIGGGGPRNDAKPYDDRTETPLLLLSRRCVGEEAGWVDGRPVNLPSRDQFDNLGTDRFPDTIERGVIDSTERPDRDMTVSAEGLGEGCGEEVRPVDEFRVIAVPGDPVVVCSPFVLGGGGRHCRHWAQGLLVGHGVHALQSQNGKF
jgi:hypothetical protein